MADIKKSVNLLPEYLQTDKNSKFLSSTIDQFIQTPQVERLEGFVGSKITPNYNPRTDFYLDEKSSLRNSYSLEPALVFRDSSSNITDVVSYDDLINEIGIQGGKNSNLDKLFNSKFYSYDPLIDWDKLINFTDYYWLPTGPDLIALDLTETVNNIVGRVSYTMNNGYLLSNGMKISAGGTVYLVEGVGLSIKLIEYKLLDSYDKTATVFNETFDNVQFDEYPFDGDKKLPLTPDYITINRASSDLNPWTRYNRWFHKEIIRITAEINDVPVIYPLSARASRPVIEFKADLKLYNFGKSGIQNIDVIDNVTTDAFVTVDGTYGYYVDGILLQQGHRVVFNNDNDLEVRGKIFQVNFDLTGEVPVLHLIGAEDLTPTDMDSVSVNFGTEYYGTSWYFNASSSKWVYAQQHETVNQPPLFDLFTSDGISYTEIDEANNFAGTQIFGYEVGTGSADTVLGFPLKYQNNIGAGSYLFKNYFMTDSITLINNNVSRTISTAITYLKLNDELTNVWADSVNYKIPVVEIQTISENTNTITLTCFDSPIDTGLTVSAYVNNKKIISNTTATTGKVTLTTDSTLSKDDVVLLKIETDQIPNSNGYYETPIGLTNNPLNGSASSLTLSELGDHVSSMLAKTSAYTGNNLRDLTDYAKYGSRLVVNASPITFSQIFLGKKEHNVVDAIRQAGQHYDQFKMNFLKAIQNVDSQLSASDALDLVLTNLNKDKDLKSLYQRSDMLGYGNNKTVRTFTVTDTANVVYPIGFEFDLTRLSFQSVLVYFNGVQLKHNTEYTFNYIDGTTTLLVPIEVGDVIDIICYSDTLGCYIPPTPTKLGLFPLYEPAIGYENSSAYGPIYSIKGHDGSVINAYNDYRDAIIFEFELRIFNNIKVQYNREIFDIHSMTSGAFRTTNYTKADVDNILINDFSQWAGTYGIDTTTNDSVNDANSFTWNYTGSFDVVDNNPVSGHYKNILIYFFDTNRPHEIPWRMLGLTLEPSWWEDEYGPGPYSSTDTKMWTDLRDGYLRGEDRYLPEYARPDLLSIIPVTSTGQFKPIETYLVTQNSYQDKRTKWKFGDLGPAELAWRLSSQYRFAIVAAAALLYPCKFCSALYDVSRTSINATGQVAYKEDDLYLDPRKLIIEGEDNNQIAGFGTYVIERGKQKDQNYLTKLRQDLDYLNVNLFHKVAGFVSKEKLQIIIDSIDPTSTSPGVVLPSEDYSLILNVSNPVETARISGIIVQRSNGNFVVKGYDIKNPYFEILQPIASMSSGVVKVGGVSEDFSDWSNTVNNGNKGLSSVDVTSAESSTGRYYKQGQLVRYNNKFYRVKIGHNAGSTFDPALFQALPELPVKGGATVQSPARFETTVTQVPYGTEFTTVQEVYDVILGYGAYLETRGFIFDEFNSDLNEMLNWKFTGKEFLYWSTQNWSDGNLITLSPFANYIKYNFPNSVVDNISTGKYEYSLLKADGKPYPIDKFTMAREDTICTIKTRDANEGLFFAVLNSVQKEHGMVFNNFTVFNDTIYDIETGYRQQRIKLSGFRTKNWNGDLFSPGFVYDNVEISDWQAYKTYLPGKVVRYNGRYYESLVKINSNATFDFTKWDQLLTKPKPQLLPNFDYKINQFEDFYSLDIDNFDYNQQQLAQHLTGYTPRTYLNNIFTNPISQYKFYQGMIKDKGTKNAVDKLAKASEFTNKGDLSFKEEWAFRVGHYGSYSALNEIEFQLEEGTYLENPYLVKFVNSLPADTNPLINYITSSTLLLKPDDYDPANTISSYAGTWEDNNLKLTTAGYVRPDDVTSTAYNKNSLLDIANNSAIQDGDTVWLGFQENGDWTVYRYTKQLAEISGVFVNAPGSEITFVTDSHHGLQAGDVISVVRFNVQVNGVYIVNSIVNTNQFTVSTGLSSIENEELLNYGALYKFEEARYNNLNDLASTSTNLLKLNAGDKVWIDSGTAGKWQVYEKVKNYSVTKVDTVDTPAGQKFGTSIFASDDSSVMMVSAPGWRVDGAYSQGRVKVFNKVNSTWTRKYDYILNSNLKTYCSVTSSTQFGYALQYDIGKKLYITGSPEATYVRADTGTVVLSTGSGYARPYIKEGLVKIDSRQEDFPIFTEIVLSNPNPAENTRFGHSIYVNQVAATTSTLMLVSAPGPSAPASTGSVYAYVISFGTGTFASTAGVTRGGQKVKSIVLSGLTTANKANTSTISLSFSTPETSNGVTATGIISWLTTSSTATATATSIIITNPGWGYLQAPTVSIIGNTTGTTGTIVTELTNETIINDHPERFRILSTGTSSIVLSAGDQWGHKIAGCSIGFAISAPGYSNDTGVVQLFNSDLSYSQTITSPFNEGGKFGYDIAVTTSGNYLLISAPEIKNINEPYGKVAIYKNNLGLYLLDQIIDNPLPTNDLKFGYSVSISKDEKTISISALGKTRSREQLFDEFSNLGQTTFDSGSTTFNEIIPDAGTVYLYNKIGDKFIQADELNDVNIVSGSRYGAAAVVTNNEVFVGAPTSQTYSASTTDTSELYIFSKTDLISQSWKVLREQEDTVDVLPIGRVALIDTLKEEVVDYLDVIDPVKGKIAGIAEQELKFKAAFDPAIYSIGLAGTIVNVETNWLDEHVGELWWDLSTAKFMWYEQGDEIFRKNNWGRMFPGASIDVYEWVKSDLLPSEWAAQADTTKGLVNSISGQPKYPDNSVISVKQVFNNVTGSFENVYYFWVKNKVTLPNAKNRRLSGYQVASYIADPVANGLKFVEILSPSAVAFANVQPMLVGNRINANIAIDYGISIPKHTEWLLLNEGDHTSVPNTLLEKKLFDSLLGHDSTADKNVVPAKNLTYRNRYGIGIRPQQTLFKDRLAALRNSISFVNAVLKENRIVGNYSFENLNKVEEIPALFSYEYDVIVEDLAALDEVTTISFVRAELKCYAINGKISSVVITNPGFGYTVSPKVTIEPNAGTGTGAEIITELDSDGRVISATIINPGNGYLADLDTDLLKASVKVRPHSIIVQVNSDSGNRWTKHIFDYSLRTWVKVQTQQYNTPLFWTTIDWSSATYDSYKIVQYTISNLFELGSLISVVDGDYVKVKNIGDGKYAVLQKVSGAGNYIPSYDIVYRENGTIQLLDSLWDYSIGKYAYDKATIEETLYDQIPDQELYYILTALKNNIFINSLKVNWNLFFFAAVKYALTEQKLLDWAFKTSFINVFNNIGTLDQRPVYKLNNEEYFENYINEVKPYHTKIRNYTSIYDKTEQSNLYTTDFDLPSYYDTTTGSLSVIDLDNSLVNSYPYKSWKDNYKFYVSAIEVGYAGSGYIQRPTVTITTATGDTGSGATAEAYIRNGELYKVIVTNSGSGYVIPPIVTISDSGNNDTARVSVIMANDAVRKNIIGLKFDRTSTVGDLTNLTVTDEFICDGTADKFTLSWLASPDKQNITPLLDGKLIFGTDYTIEYYQIAEENVGIDVERTFPENSWKGEKMVDHRYRYFLNTNRSGDVPKYIKHYSKFVFLNRVPRYGQVFKVTYNKNIDLYNAVDRINSLYNPDDLMPGKELPLLMEGAEYPGISIQGLMFNQTPNWDNTGTQYDAAPWGDTVASYAVAKLRGRLGTDSQWIDVDSSDGIFAGQTITPLNTTTQIFRPTTVVERVAGTRIFISTLDVADTQIKRIYSTGTTATSSTIIISTVEPFHTTIQPGDYILIGGVNSNGGYGIDYINTTTVPILSTSTTSLVTAVVSPPDLPNGRQAQVQLTQVGLTVTSISVLLGWPGIGYSVPPTLTFSGTASPVTPDSYTVVLDPGFNLKARVMKSFDNYVEIRSGRWELGSTSTTLNPGASFRLLSLVNGLEASNKLLYQATEVMSSSTVLSVQTFAPFNDVVRAEVKFKEISTTTTVDLLSTSTNTFWYSISNSIDGLDRAIVSMRHSTSTATFSGSMSVSLFGATELEFYSTNNDYSSLDSVISGSTINDTSLGYKPEDIIIDGNNFLNAVDSYAPEECVPGYVTDSVGINVFTAAESSSYPMVVSGAFAAGNGSITRATLSWLPEAPLGFRVQADGQVFNRVINETAFTSSTQYCIFDNTIVVPSQPAYTIVGYSFVTAGADTTVDSTYIGVETTTPGNTGTISVTSLLGFDDVRSVYVLLNGEEVPPSGNPTSLSTYGYVLSPAATNNNRAMITVNGLSSNQYNLEAWFFDYPFPKFNTFHEQYYNIGSTATFNLILDRAPGTIEPVSEQIIVEKITLTGRERLVPPWASYHRVQNGLMTYAIDPKNDRPATYNLDNVKVYINGIELRPGYDFTVNAGTQNITLIKPGIVNGDAIAIVALINNSDDTYDYFVSGRNLLLTQAITSATIKVTSFTDHDNMMIRTERFKGNDPVILTYPVLNENYVWITVNDTQLTAGFDYSVMEDFRSIEFAGSVNISSDDDIIVVVFNPPSYGSSVLGYRIFKDMFGKHHYKRISEYFSTRLAQPLQYTDNSIVVVNGDHLLQPNPSRNLPGVIYVDGERIEYTAKDGNVLSGLRRSTLGTGPAKFSDIGTEVIDQSIRQNIPTTDYSLIQHIPSSNTTTYAINTITVVDTISFSINTTTHVGNGIELLPLVNPVDQIEVYYGGRQLRKTSMRVHDKSVSYYDSAAGTIIYPPEFIIATTCSLTATSINSTSTTIQTDVLYGNRVLSPAKVDKEFNIGNIRVVSTITTATNSYLQFIEPIPGISNQIQVGDTLTVNSKSVVVLGLLGEFFGNPTPGKLGFLLSSNIVASSEDVTSLHFLRSPTFTAKIAMSIGTTGSWTTSTTINILNTITTGTIGTSTAIYSIGPNINDRFKAVCTVTNLNTSVTSIVNLSLYDYQQITLNIAEEITTGTRITVVKREAEFWTDTSSTSLLSSTGTQANFIRSRPAELPDIYFYGGEKVLIENSIALTDENGEPLEGY